MTEAPANNPRHRGLPRFVRWVTNWYSTSVARSYIVGMGILFGCVGSTWIFIPSRSRELGIEWVPAMSAPLIGVLWLIIGMIGVMIGLTRRDLYAVGFKIMQFYPSVVSFVFGVSWLLSWIPDDIYEIGSPNAVVNSLTYLIMWFQIHMFGKGWDYVNNAAQEHDSLEAKQQELEAQVLAMTRRMVAQGAEELRRG